MNGFQKKVISDCKASNKPHCIRLKTFRSIEDLNEFLEEIRNNNLKCEIDFMRHITSYETYLKIHS